MHFPGKLDGAAHESKGHTAGVILAESVPFELLLFIALATLAGKSRPFLADGEIKAIPVVATEHVAPYLVATFHSYVTFWFSPCHDRLLKFRDPVFQFLIAAPRLK
jgi:hypothetical protein